MERIRVYRRRGFQSLAQKPIGFHRCQQLIGLCECEQPFQCRRSVLALIVIGKNLSETGIVQGWNLQTGFGSEK